MHRPPCNCPPPFPPHRFLRPEPFSPGPGPCREPDRAAWLKAQLAKKYEKPDSGIPKADLAEDVRTSLGKADAAVQPDDILSGGKVKSDLLPSYVDDVIEVADYASLPNPGEEGKIYVTLDTNKTYRWGGSEYVEISNPDLTEYAKRAELFPAWAKNTAYTTTGLVIHENAVYKCTTAHTSGAEWDSTKWAVASGAEVLAMLRDYAALSNKPSINGNTLTGNKTGADLGLATTADATLTPVYGEWVCNPAKVLYGDPSQPTEIAVAVYKPNGMNIWALSDLGNAAAHSTTFMSSRPYDPAATSLTFTIDSAFIPRTVTATRAVVGYTLGSQTDKPLASEAEAEALRDGKLDKADVVAPSTSASDSGKAADAKATGDALALIAPGWSQSNSYQQYDVVKKDGAYYYAKDAIAANTAWNANSWGSLASLAALAHKFLPLTGGTMTGPLVVWDKLTLGHENGGSPTGELWFYGSLTGSPGLIGIKATADGRVQLLSKYDDAITPVSMFALLKNIASDFSTSATYAQDALCVYNGVLYRCTTAITAAEAWNSAHWTEATVEDVIAALRTALDGKLSVGSDGTVITNVELTGMDIASLATVVNGGVVGNFMRFRVGRLTDDHFIAPAYDAITQKYGFWVKNGANDTATFYALADFAPLASPALTGTPTAPTAAAGTNTTQVATTEFVQGAGATKFDSTSAAPAFSSDSSTQYAVDSRVTYNGKLYKCTTATTGGTWVAGSWAEDTMTDPDAVLDISAQNQLRVVAKDGTILWAQGYDLASTSSAALACDAVNNFTFADGATSQAFALPTAPIGKVGDFGLDIDNSANTGAATMTLTGLDTTFSVVVPKGESLNDMLAIAAGELAQFYITLSTFRVNNLPTWHIVKQVVENGGATV